jgi:hypothetical protein
MIKKYPLFVGMVLIAFLTSFAFVADAAPKKPKAPKSPPAKSKPSKKSHPQAADQQSTISSTPVLAAAASNAPLIINGVTVTLEQVARVAPLVKFHEYEKWFPSSFDYIATNSAMEKRISLVKFEDDGSEELESQTNWVVQAAPILPQDFLINQTNWAETRYTNSDGVFVESYFLKIPDSSASFSRYGEPVKTTGAFGGHWQYTGFSEEPGFRTLPKSDWRVESPMYVAIQVPTNGAYVDLTFEMVFPFNGPQCFRTDSFFGNDFDYYFPDFANHEGDIEGVRIRVDPTFNRILFVQTFAHGSEFSFMYPPGDIVFWPDTNRFPAGQILEVEGSHPIIHSGLHSHATWNPAYRSDRSREIFLESINLFDEKIGGDFKVWQAQASIAAAAVVLVPLRGVLLALDLTTVIISDNTKTRVCDIIGYGGAQWRPFENPAAQLVLVGLDTNGLPINDQPWTTFAGRIGDLVPIAPHDTVPIGDDSFANFDQDRRADLIRSVTIAAFDAGKLPAANLHGNGPSGLGGRGEMQMSTPPNNLPSSIVYLQSGISPDFVLTAHSDGGIVIEHLRAGDPTQLWEMRLYDRWGLAYINQGTGKALGVDAGEPLVQVDPEQLNYRSLWTLGSDEGLGFHAVRPRITDDINLNVAGNGPYNEGSTVIGFDGWGGGKINEVWRFYDPTNTVELMLRSPIQGFNPPLVLSIATNGASDALSAVVDHQNVSNPRQRWIRKQRLIGWELRNAADGWYLFGANASRGFGQQMFLVPPFENSEDYRDRLFQIFSELPGVGSDTFLNIFGDNASDLELFKTQWEKHTQWTTTPSAYGSGADFFNIRLAASYNGYFQGVFGNFFGFPFFDTPSINVFGDYPNYHPGGPVGLWLGTRDSDDNELWAMDLIIDGKIQGIHGATGPVINCPGDMTVTNDPGVCGATVAFTVTASDPSFPSATNANIVCTYPSGSLFPVGVTTNVCTVQDTFGNESSCLFLITVFDLEAPRIQAPASVSVGNDPGQCGAVVTFAVTATDNCSASLVVWPPSGSFFPKGTNLVTCTAMDPSGNMTIKTFPVIVSDIEPPAIQSVTASPASLWAPNHKMNPISVSVVATDNCAIASTRIVSVHSNEPANGVGDGNTSPDWLITGDLTLELRAERSGTGNGRVYTVTVEVTDTSGNKTQKTTAVVVPKNGAS